MIDLTTLRRLRRPHGLDAEGCQMWEAFRNHVVGCRQRRIPFLFSFEAWCAWWRTDDRWQRRGRGRDSLVMARLRDDGPYHPLTVMCLTQAENMRHGLMQAQEALRPYCAYLGVRGLCHPSSRAVATPRGHFGSAAVAADRFGITRQYAAQLAREQRDGWRYVSSHSAAVEER